MQYRPDLDMDFPYAVKCRLIWSRGSYTNISEIVSDLINWLNENINTESDINYKLSSHPIRSEIVLTDSEIVIPHYVHFRHEIDAVRFELSYN